MLKGSTTSVNRSEEEEEPKISLQNGKKKAIESTRKFLEQCDFATEEDLKFIHNIYN